MSKNNIGSIFKSVQKTLVKRSPEIAVGIGIAGMLTTTVLAVKATPKALSLVEEEKTRINEAIHRRAMEKNEEPFEIEKLTPVETVKVAWKCYIPAAVTGAMSIACLIGASSVNARRNAAIATAYAMSETALREYKDKVVETIGEKKEREVRDSIAKEKIEKNPVSQNKVIITENGETLCYDAISGRYFKSDIEKVKRGLNEVNKRLLDDSYVSLNDFYDAIDLEVTKIGYDIGWNISQGLIDLDFSSQLTDDGKPCLVLDYRNDPGYDFDKWL